MKTKEDWRNLVGFLLLCIVFVGVSGESQPAIRAQLQPSLLQIAIRTDSPQYKVGSPILIMIKETNRSSSVLLFNHLSAVIDYDLVVTSSAGVMESASVGNRSGYPATAPIRQNGLHPGTTVTSPGSSGDYTPLYGWGINITSPGDYTVQAISRETKRRSNVARFRVLP